jgi:hypothetical protein
MRLLPDEQNALNDWILGLDQIQFATFLQQNGLLLPHITSPLFSMPIISGHFLLWLTQHSESVTVILTAVEKEYPAHPSTPRLREALLRLALAAQRVGGDAWTAYLPGDIPVANRAPLRDVLKRLVRSNSPAVVMIDGPTGTGRSHSWVLISHVARSAGIIPIRIDLLSRVIDQRTIESVFDHLAKKLEIAVKRSSTIGATPETVAARYADDIATALDRLADGKRRWIVFDSLDRPYLPEIKLFICELVQLRLADEFRNCHFFLLGANRDYGVKDPNLLADLERLSPFISKEITDAAEAINALGSHPKTAAQLGQWLQPWLDGVLHLDAHEACLAIGQKLVELRIEVRV